jgi:hypothetical protein
VGAVAGSVPDLDGYTLGACCLVTHPGMVKLSVARCRGLAVGFEVCWWVDLCIVFVVGRRGALILGLRSMGCIPGRCSFHGCYQLRLESKPWCEGASMGLGVAVLFHLRLWLR